MADIRINSLSTTASASSSDDFLALDGATNGTRKLDAYSPTFGGNLTVSGGTITGGTSGLSLASGGTNQSITLTPSGTGKVTLSNGTSAQPMLDITNTNTVPTKNGLRILGPNATSSSARQFALIANSTAYGDLELRRSTTNTGDPTSGDYIFGVSANGNLLLGTTTDGGQKFQVNGNAYVSGGLSSGGNGTIGGTLAVNGTDVRITAATGYFYAGSPSTLNGLAISSGANRLDLYTNNIVALTLDSSQNATFAGWVKATGTVGNPPASGTSFSSSARFGTGNNIALDFGNTVTGYVGAWIQSHDKSDQSINYTLALNPNGGAVTIGGNLTVSGTQNVFALPASASALTNNSTMTFELTSNTSLTIKVRGTDGTIRSVALTLA